MTGSRAWGRWPDPSRTVSAPFASSASRAPEAQGRTASSLPWMTSTGQLDAREQLAHALLVLEPGCELGRDERLGVGLEAPADAVLALLGGVRLGEALREEELEEVLVVLEPVVAVPLPPADVLVARLAELRSPPSGAGQPAGSGRAGAMNTMLRRRAPGGSPRGAATVPRPARATRATARSVPVASITASASAANSSSRYASGSGGRSERPLPRPSNVSTRQCRARYGICIFQCREWTIDQVGRSSTVGSPEP